MSDEQLQTMHSVMVYCEIEGLSGMAEALRQIMADEIRARKKAA